MSWRNELTVGILRADRIFYGTSNGGLGSELDITELGYLDGVTAGTALASKALVLGASKEIAQITTLGATAINLGLAAGELGVLTLYPATTAKGDFVLKCQDNSGDDTYTLQTPLATGAAVSMTLPDVTGYLVAGTAQITLAEADVLDGAVQGTAGASKALVVDASIDIAGIRNIGNTGTVISTGNISSGVQDTTPGAFFAFGDTTASTIGGKIELQAAADYDATIESFSIRVVEDDLSIGPNTDTDSLTFLGGSDKWVVRAANGMYFDGVPLNCAGVVNLGGATVENFSIGTGTIRGLLTLEGQVTGSVLGGEIELDTADDHDTSIDYFGLKVTSEVLNIGSDLVPTAIQISAAIINFNESIYSDQAVEFAGSFTYGGTAITATGAELNTKEFTVELGDLSGADTAYIACPVAGTVTRIDTVVSGDPGADSTITLNVNGGSAMSNPLTIASGSGAGVRDTAAPGTNNVVAVGDAIFILNDATPSNAVKAYVTITVTL